MSDENPPPVTKYKYTLTVYGNSHEEVEDEVLLMTRGGYLLDSKYGERDEFRVTGGRSTRILEHTNPEQTPEEYMRELKAWSFRPRPV